MSLHNGIAVTRSPARAISAGDVRPSTQGAPVLKVRAGEMHAAAQTASTSAHVRPSMTLTSGHGLQEEEAALWSQPSTLGLVGGVSGLVAVGSAKKCFAAEKGSWRKVPAREERVV